MSFELKIADARPLKALVAAVCEFADQAILEIHTEAVNLAVDVVLENGGTLGYFLGPRIEGV